MINLSDEQIEAVQKMKIGCVLCGKPGSGKSRTALAYYYEFNGGDLCSAYNHKFMSNPCDLYIITTAKKRDSKEWEGELTPFMMDCYNNNVIVDSWNNIKKYVSVTNSFFIFDEQRAVGYGTWSKSFIKIAKQNHWVMLSATPGDKWTDYIPLFIANGFYKNKTDFESKHVIWDRYSNYPKVKGWYDTDKLTILRNKILVPINYKKHTYSNHINIHSDYNKSLYDYIMKNRWDPYKNEPIDTAASLCYCLRKCVNSDQNRYDKVNEILEHNEKAIIFYNFDYELEGLKKNILDDFVVKEWNGHKHDELPEGNKWAYLVQYTAGSEGWNCITTDTIIFFSQNYSYKTTEQARGRIDRRNTPYQNLYYYYIRSKSGIDMAIYRKLKDKKKFNENVYFKGFFD